MPVVKTLNHDKHIARLEYKAGNLSKEQYIAITDEIDVRIEHYSHEVCDCVALIERYL